MLKVWWICFVIFSIWLFEYDDIILCLMFMVEKLIRGIFEMVFIFFGKKYRVFKGIFKFGRLLEMILGYVMFGNIEGEVWLKKLCYEFC